MTGGEGDKETRRQGDWGKKAPGLTITKSPGQVAKRPPRSSVLSHRSVFRPCHCEGVKRPWQSPLSLSPGLPVSRSQNRSSVRGEAPLPGLPLSQSPGQELMYTDRRGGIMAENGEPKPDYLKGWLITLTVISGLVWLICTISIINSFLEFPFPPTSRLDFIVYGCIFLPPITLSLSWILWQKDKREASGVISFFQVLISGFSIFISMLLFHY